MQNAASRLVPVIFLFVGLVSVFHPAIMSGFARIQTDLGDARYANYMLEHGYMWVWRDPLHLGFWDPPFFFPARNVGAYAETLLGSAPLYWIWRLVGLEADTSYQAWLMVVVGLDFVAAYMLIRRCLELPGLAAAGGAYVFAFANLRANQLDAPQILPQFYTIGVLICLFRLFREAQSLPHASRIWIPLMTCCAVLQVYSSFYLGFFLFLGMLACLLAAASMREARRHVIGQIVTNRMVILLAALVGLAALSWMAYHYLLSQMLFGTRHWAEVSSMLPQWKSWINMGPGNWLYGWTGRYIDLSLLPDGPENRLGLGLITPVLAVTGLAVMWRSAWGRVLVVATAAVTILTLRYPWDWSPWQVVSPFIWGAGAIRAVTRVSLLLLIPLSIGVAVTLQGLQRRSTALALIAVCVMAAEQVNTTPSYDKTAARERVERITSQLPAGCKSFYAVMGLAPNTKSDPWYEYQLDAMWAGMKAGVPTVNGFSGHVPPDWWPLWEPVIKTGSDFLAARVSLFRWTLVNGMTMDDVSVVPVLRSPIEGLYEQVDDFHLDVGQPPARPYLGEGWSDDEWDQGHSWVWVVGKKATLYVPLTAGADYSMRFVAGPMEFPGRSQTLRVRLNGTELGQLTMAAGMNAYELNLPTNAVRSFNVVELDFGFSVSPMAIGKADDTRSLAAAFDTITFKVSKPPAAPSYIPPPEQ